MIPYPFETIVVLIEGRVCDQIWNQAGSRVRNQVGERLNALRLVIDQTLVIARESESS